MDAPESRRALAMKVLPEGASMMTWLVIIKLVDETEGLAGVMLVQLLACLQQLHLMKVVLNVG